MSLRLQLSGGAEDRLMLGGPGDDEAGLRRAAGYTEEREIDRLGSGGRERDLGAVGAQGLRGDVAGGIKSRAGGSAFSVRAQRISVWDFAKGGGDLRQDRCRAGIVKKNPQRGTVRGALPPPMAPLPRAIHTGRHVSF
jgi:hypothetical protein